MSEKSDDDEPEVDRKGHEIAEGDRKHPSGHARPRSGLGRSYGQGVGYGGYDFERNQAESQTGAADRKKGGSNAQRVGRRNASPIPRAERHKQGS